MAKPTSGPVIRVFIAQRPISTKREIKRHAFEIYRDQLDSLKQLKMITMLSGDLISMSEMVRTALDQFIQNKQNDKKPNDPNAPYG